MVDRRGRGVRLRPHRRRHVRSRAADVPHLVHDERRRAAVRRHRRRRVLLGHRRHRPRAAVRRRPGDRAHPGRSPARPPPGSRVLLLGSGRVHCDVRDPAASSDAPPDPVAAWAIGQRHHRRRRRPRRLRRGRRRPRARRGRHRRDRLHPHVRGVAAAATALSLVGGGSFPRSACCRSAAGSPLEREWADGSDRSSSSPPRARATADSVHPIDAVVVRSGGRRRCRAAALELLGLVLLEQLVVVRRLERELLRRRGGRRIRRRRGTPAEPAAWVRL